MIKFKAKHLTDHGFMMTLPANKGNDQLTIFTSFGPSGKTNLVCIASDAGDAVSCGDHRILYNTAAISNSARKKRGRTYTPEEAVTAIHGVLIDWTTSKEIVSDKDQDETDKEVGKVIMHIAQKFGLTKSELSTFTEMFTKKQNSKLAKHRMKQAA